MDCGLSACRNNLIESSWFKRILFSAAAGIVITSIVIAILATLQKGPFASFASSNAVAISGYVIAGFACLLLTLRLCCRKKNEIDLIREYGIKRCFTRNRSTHEKAEVQIDLDLYKCAVQTYYELKNNKYILAIPCRYSHQKETFRRTLAIFGGPEMDLEVRSYYKDTNDQIGYENVEIEDIQSLVAALSSGRSYSFAGHTC